MIDTNTPEFIETRRCIYCFRDKPLDQYSFEHIWPDALGGKLCPDLFKTHEVCAHCNNTCGLFVDGAFIKSWFVQLEIVNQAYRFLDPRRPSPAPLLYFGIEPNVSTEDDQICERWQGLAGERVYHFHLADEARWNAFAGGDTIRRKKKDPGRAYLALTSSEEYWAFTAALSFREQFSAAKRCVITEVASDEPEDVRVLEVLFPRPDKSDPQQVRDIARLATAVETTSTVVRAAVQGDFDSRFLCKLALGLGHQILGSQHGESRYGAELCQGLWARDPAARQDLKIGGSGMLGEVHGSIPQEIRTLMSWPGAWSLCIWKHGDELAAHIRSPSGNLQSVVIANELSKYEGVDLRGYRDGQMFFISLPGQSFLGPVGLPEFLAHKMGVQAVPELAEAALREIQEAALPPKNLPPRDAN